MVKVAGWLSALVVVAWVFLMADVQSNFTDDPQARIAYEVATFYAVVALLVIWLVVLIARR
jgi:Na+/phosphate symporter